MRQWDILVSLLFVWTVVNFRTSNAVIRCDAAHKKFQCPDGGPCITLSQRCNFFRDCPDAADEKNCTFAKCNNATHFTCKNRKCVYKEWVCDGSDDCHDNSDEEASFCAKRTCSPQQFSCAKSNTCIPLKHKCDHDIDCDHGEDEEGCPPPECDDAERLCADKKECMPKEYFCDGEEDCTDGSDERNCSNLICQEDQFSCADGKRCISKTARCDGLSDCVDRSDEKDCTAEESNRCDKGFFPCASNGLCLPDMFKCDGLSHCRDKSDELNCTFEKDSCPTGSRLCANKRQCIITSKWCDGTRDCIDKSDETECAGLRPVSLCPHETHFRCQSGKCIEERKLCDTYSDCPNKDDEPPVCRQNECELGNGNCSQNCIDLKIGYKCSCRTGYMLANDNKTCEDINECKTLDNTCVGECVNEEGSFRCHNGNSTVTFVVGDRDKIVSFNLQHDYGIPKTLISGGINVHSVAVDVKKNIVYWSDVKSETISSANLKNNSTKVILDSKLVENPINLALDWVHDLLYWVETDPSSVSVISVDGTHPKTLIRPYDELILSIALHPKYGLLYVGYVLSSRSNAGKMKQCGMDGKNCTVIVSKQISAPIDIAIDYDQDRLYWIDEQLQILVISNLDGTSRKNVVMNTHRPYSLAFFSGRVYFTDDETRRLYSTDRKGEIVKVYKKGLGRAADLAILEENSQSDGTNQCLHSPCKGMCLPKKSSSSYVGFTCICPDGFVTSRTDKNDCIEKTTTTPQPSSSPPAKSTTRQLTTSTSNSTAGVPINASASSSKAVMVIGIITLLVLACGLICVVLRYRKRRFARMSMNFNNPIYKKMTTDANNSSSRLSGITDPSPTTSSGDVSNHSNDGTAALVLYEEIPENRPVAPTVSGVKFSTEPKYQKVPNGDVEIDFDGNTVEAR